jgi:hypothetical protein
MTIVTERKTERKSCPKPIGYYSEGASLLAYPALGNGEKITLKGAINLLEIFSVGANRAYSDHLEGYEDGHEFGEAVSEIYSAGEFQLETLEGLTDDDLDEIWCQVFTFEEYLALVRWCSDLIQCRMYDARQSATVEGQ